MCPARRRTLGRQTPSENSRWQPASPWRSLPRLARTQLSRPRRAWRLSCALRPPTRLCEGLAGKRTHVVYLLLAAARARGRSLLPHDAAPALSARRLRSHRCRARVPGSGTPSEAWRLPWAGGQFPGQRPVFGLIGDVHRHRFCGWLLIEYAPRVAFAHVFEQRDPLVLRSKRWRAVLNHHDLPAARDPLRRVLFEHSVQVLRGHRTWHVLLKAPPSAGLHCIVPLHHVFVP